MFLLIKNGIDYYQIFARLKEQNVRLIFLQSDMRYVHVSVLYNLNVMNFDRLLVREMGNDTRGKCAPMSFGGKFDG